MSWLHAARNRPASLRGRVVLGVLVLLLVLLTGLFVTVDALLTSRLHADLRTRLTDRAALATQLDGALSAQQLVDRLRGDGVTALLCSPADSSTGTSGSSSTGTDGAATCVSAAAAGPAPPGSGPAPGSGDPALPGAAPAKKGRGGAGHGRPAASAVRSDGPVLYVRTTLPSTQQVLTLSVDSSQVGTALHRLITLELIGGLIVLVLAALLLGKVVAGALRPLDRMTALAGQIGAGDRGRRLRSGRPDTELGRTATAFDAMLDELESALAAAAAAESRLRGFLNDVSHELRTPLTGLAATTETLLRNEPDHAAREKAYVTLVRETRRASRLVDDLLTVTRLDTGMSLTTDQVDLCEIAGHEMDRTRLLAPELTLTLCGAASAPVQGDAVRLGQIIANLLDNARTAAGPRGTVSVEIERAEQGVHLDVSDSGQGVPNEDRERIFDRLVRLDASRSRKGGGSGLGLAIARGLARAHDGELVCIGAPNGCGARFRLWLPARLSE